MSSPTEPLVCAGFSSGGYAEKVVVPESQVFPVPSSVTLEAAACLPYAACTVWSALFTNRELSDTFWLPKEGDISMPRLSAKYEMQVHDDSNGIASFAIQSAKCRSITTIVTWCEDRKGHFVDLQVDKWIDYKDFLAQGQKASEQGVDVILNVLGPEHFQQNLSCLNLDGKLISIGDFRTNKMDTANSLPSVDDDSISRKYVGAAAFQHRRRAYRELITKEVQDNVWPRIELAC